MPVHIAISLSEEAFPSCSQWSLIASAKATGDTGDGLYEVVERPSSMGSPRGSTMGAEEDNYFLIETAPPLIHSRHLAQAGQLWVPWDFWGAIKRSGVQSTGQMRTQKRTQRDSWRGASSGAVISDHLSEKSVRPFRYGCERASPRCTQGWLR